MPSAEHQPPDAIDEAARERDAQALVGSTLRGKWHLNALIAVGGMAAVYDATHRNGMRGAVKVLDPQLARSIGARDRFLREGRLANQVHHPGAVRVLDDDETPEGTAYLVMELLTGATLDALATRAGGTLEPAAVIAYGLQILDTLAEAHAHGIVHRDIKPENLFVTVEGRVKVLDFGIAGMVRRDVCNTLTRAGETVGTPAFMSPEQARGRWELVDQQSDLYSLGASLFTLLTGKFVHEGAGTVGEMLALSIMQASPSLAELMPTAPDALVRAIDGALKQEKAERWPSAAAMRGALEEAYLAVTYDHPPRAHENLGVRRLPRVRWLVSLAIMGVAGIALASVHTGREPREAQHATPALATSHASPTNALVCNDANPPSPRPHNSALVRKDATTTPAKVGRYDAIYDRRH